MRLLRQRKDVTENSYVIMVVEGTAQVNDKYRKQTVCKDMKTCGQHDRKRAAGRCKFNELSPSRQRSKGRFAFSTVPLKECSHLSLELTGGVSQVYIYHRGDIYLPNSFLVIRLNAVAMPERNSRGI